MTQDLLDYARQRGLQALDTFDAIAAWKGKSAASGLYGVWHMNDAGNKLTAGLFAAALKAHSD